MRGFNKKKIFHLEEVPFISKMRTPFCTSCLNDTCYSLSVNELIDSKRARLYSYCLDCIPLNENATYYWYNYKTEHWDEVDYKCMSDITHEYKKLIFGKSLFNKNG